MTVRVGGKRPAQVDGASSSSDPKRSRLGQIDASLPTIPAAIRTLIAEHAAKIKQSVMDRLADTETKLFEKVASMKLQLGAIETRLAKRQDTLRDYLRDIQAENAVRTDTISNSLNILFAKKAISDGDGLEKQA